MPISWMSVTFDLTLNRGPSSTGVTVSQYYGPLRHHMRPAYPSRASG